jgi:hypothetical protein
VRELMCAPHRVKLPQILGSMPIELVKNVWILYIAPNTLGNRSIPSPLEKVAGAMVVEAIDPRGNERAGLVRLLFINRQLGILGTNLVHHYKRRIVVIKSRISPMVVDLLVDATDKIRQRNVQFQCVNGICFFHRENNLPQFL